MKSKNIYSLPIDKKDLREVVSDSRAHFAHFKHAIDFALPEGTKILAPFAGKVIQLKTDSNEGGAAPKYNNDKYMNYLTLQHKNGEYSQYIHLKHKGGLVKIGDKVKKGQPIALSGNTGLTTEPHLHFQVFKLNKNKVGWETLKINFREKLKVYRPQICSLKGKKNKTVKELERVKKKMGEINKKPKIIPSIIAKNQKELNERIGNVKNYFPLLQLDVMDGKFVKNKSLNFNFKLPRTKCKYEAHLMIENPEKWIEKNWKKADMIIFHLEATKERTSAVIELIKSKKRKAGIAINPRTSAGKIQPYLRDVDEVLVMTVNPGKYGAKFLPLTLKKVKHIRKLKPKLNIEVDGGISDKTIKSAGKAGANMFISGSYLQKSKDIKSSISILKYQLNKR